MISKTLRWKRILAFKFHAKQYYDYAYGTWLVMPGWDVTEEHPVERKWIVHKKDGAMPGFRPQTYLRSLVEVKKLVEEIAKTNP